MRISIEMATKHVVKLTIVDFVDRLGVFECIRPSVSDIIRDNQG